MTFDVKRWDLASFEQVSRSFSSYSRSLEVGSMDSAESWERFIFLCFIIAIRSNERQPKLLSVSSLSSEMMMVAFNIGYNAKDLQCIKKKSFLIYSLNLDTYLRIKS